MTSRAMMVLLLGCAALLAMAWAARSNAVAQDQAEKPKLLRHVVCFKFKSTATPEDLRRIEAGFRALPSKIDAIRDFEWGTNNSPEGKAKEFTHCFLVTFADDKGRDAYLPHPAHQEFVQLAGPHIEDVFVLDYWAQD